MLTMWTAIDITIAMQEEGMLFETSKHYCEAEIVLSTHLLVLKLLRRALFSRNKIQATEYALEEAIFLYHDYKGVSCSQR